MDQQVTYSDDEVIVQYLKLRTVKNLRAEQRKQEDARIDLAMETLENMMLARLNERGAQNTKTESGTAYKKTTAKCTVTDFDLLLNYIRDHGAWSLLTKHVSKEEVKTIVDLTRSPPPGVDWQPITKVYFNKA